MRLVACVLNLATIAAALAAQCPVVSAADRFDGFDEYVERALETWSIPGLSITVVKNGRIVLSRSYGVCERGTDERVDETTLFPIASCTKSMVAASVARLVDDGKLRWDDPVIRHYADFELANDYLTRNLTLRDLLCHRTGLQRCDLLMEIVSPDKVLNRLKHIPPAAPPRTAFTYSNPMYLVLRHVVADVSDEPWETFVAQRIWQPLGMSSTFASVSRNSGRRVAKRHWNSDDGIVARSAADDGVHSTANDMARWLLFQLAEGRTSQQRLLQEQTVREMHALQFSVPVRNRQTNNHYSAQFYGPGLGWIVQDYRGHKIVSHGGSWGAMAAMMPDQKLGVVVLSNLDLSSLPALLMYDVFDAYLIGPVPTWNPEKWQQNWLRSDPPGNAYKPRDAARAELEKQRTLDTTPSLPSNKYAGDYESDLYGRFSITGDDDSLSLRFGKHTSALTHWDRDSFYARTPTRLTFDWLITFDVSESAEVSQLTVKHIGWDKREKDHVFMRRKAVGKPPHNK